MLSISILTTDTIHHAFFVKQLAKKYRKIRIFTDKLTLSPPFPIHHPYELERDQFEIESWFNNQHEAKLENYAECVYLNDINSEEAKTELTAYNADINIVFGTKKISRILCEIFSGRLVNLHGGDPQKYRGLDSHLWALYHHDKCGLLTTLHEINPILDDGNIIGSLSLDFSKIDKLSQLRKENTEVCIKLVEEFLQSYDRNKLIQSYKQNQIGRYYSFMPSVLKEVVYANFNNGKYHELFR